MRPPLSVTRTWLRGSSLELKHRRFEASGTTKKNHFLLEDILEGADRDEGSSTPTYLARFGASVVDATGTRTLGRAGTCVGRTDAGADTSGDACGVGGGALLGNMRWSYSYFNDDCLSDRMY